MLAFEGLGEDIILLLLSLCDIETVLLMGRVNQFFRQLTMRKQLWIVLVEDLISRSLVDRPHARSLAEHSVEELIALVKRTVLGPATWSADTPPTLAEEVSLPDALLAVEDLQLLPGGRFVLLVRENDIELWNICGKTPLWMRNSNRWAMRALEMLDGGRSVVICLSYMRSNSVAVIQVNLETGESEDLFTTLLTKCHVEGGVLALSGDLLAHAVYWDSDNAEHRTIYAILLVDWRLQRYVLIWHPRHISLSTFVPTIKLFPDHIFFTMTFDEIFVYAAADFTSRWRPITSMTFDDFVDWRSRDITPAVIARLEDFPAAGPVEKLFMPDLMLYRSPLRRATYKLIIFHSGTITAPSKLGNSYSPFRVLLTYRFSTSPDSGALEGWARTSAILAGTSVFRRGTCISYAGYNVNYAVGSYNVVDLRRPQPDNDLASVVLETNKRFRTAVSPYSHACLQLRDSTLVVSYYV